MELVVTASGLPGKGKVGHLKKDQYVLVPVGEETHFLGDPIVLIARARPRNPEPGRAELVKVDYQELTPVCSPREAMAPDAPQLQEGGNLLAHERLVRGNADAKIAASKYVVTTKYITPPTEHAFLEPETAVAAPENGGVVIYSGDQGIYQTKKECAEATACRLKRCGSSRRWSAVDLAAKRT